MARHGRSGRKGADVYKKVRQAQRRVESGYFDRLGARFPLLSEKGFTVTEQGGMRVNRRAGKRLTLAAVERAKREVGHARRS